ncbi:MAG: glutamate formimidoyltransferase [Firmicutes bacterium]|nr:glutamate formimidoyltransferase [Bacillota bacterium]
MQKIIQCVPNFSEGRDKKKVEKIIDCFRNAEGVKLLDYSLDADHNRTVVTIVGDAESLKKAVLSAVEVALKIIDLTKHEGQHPRMGACDVVPFIPIKNVTEEEVIALSKEVGEEIGKLGIPVFLYEKSATASHRENLADVRRGQFEGLEEKMKDAKWNADFGTKDAPHKTFGAVAVCCRMPLVAFNVNLGTDNLDIATAIGKKVRFLGGGLRYCKAMGVDLAERKITQVSMNLTDHTKTTIYSVIELVRIEAKRYGVPIVGSEVIGLVPMQALVDCAEYYLQIENFSIDQVLEYKIME